MAFRTSPSAVCAIPCECFHSSPGASPSVLPISIQKSTITITHVGLVFKLLRLLEVKLVTVTFLDTFLRNVGMILVCSNTIEQRIVVPSAESALHPLATAARSWPTAQGDLATWFPPLTQVLMSTQPHFKLLSVTVSRVNGKSTYLLLNSCGYFDNVSFVQPEGTLDLVLTYGQGDLSNETWKIFIDFTLISLCFMYFVIMLYFAYNSCIVIVVIYWNNCNVCEKQHSSRSYFGYKSSNGNQKDKVLYPLLLDNCFEMNDVILYETCQQHSLLLYEGLKQSNRLRPIPEEDSLPTPLKGFDQVCSRKCDHLSFSSLFNFSVVIPCRGLVLFGLYLSSLRCDYVVTGYIINA